MKTIKLGNHSFFMYFHHIVYNASIGSGGSLTDFVEGGFPSFGEGLQVHLDLPGGAGTLQ